MAEVTAKMGPMAWDETGKRFYETGVSKVGLYIYNTTTNKYDSGVAWSGITGITENPSGADASDLYADNVKYATLRSAEQLGLSIEAYMYPDEFGTCDGTETPVTGVQLRQQTRNMFGLSYRTEMGNDVGTDVNDGYKLHLVYGCTASPSSRSYSSINESPDAITFSWDVSCTPVAVAGFKPLCSIDIDSRTVNAAKLKDLETKLYGTSTKAPELPMPMEVLTALGYTAPSAT